MTPKIPPAGTQVLASDNRGRPTPWFSRPWYDFLLELARLINESGGGSPGTFTFTQSDVVLGRASAGGGAGEELTFTDQAQQLADDTSFAEMRDTLGIDASTTPYTPSTSGDWTTVPDDVAEALDYLVSSASVFDVDTILTDGDQVLVDSDGNVLTEA